MVGFGASQALRLCTNLVLLRLVTDQGDWGYVTLVWSFLAGLQMLSDLALWVTVIQHPRGAEPGFRHTAFTVQVLRGLAVAMVAVAAAPWVAAFYAEAGKAEGNVYDPELLTALIRGASVTVVLTSFASISLYTQNRHLAMGRLVAIDIGSQAVGMAAAIGFACYHPSSWALIANAIATAFVRTAASHLFLPGANRFGWDREAARAIFSFGRWALIGTLLFFLVGQADRMIFAPLAGDELLGVYGNALQLAMIPADLAGRLINSVLFPVLSRADRAGFGAAFQRQRRPILVGCGFMLCGVCAGGQAAVDLIYPAKWAGCGPFVSILTASLYIGSVLAAVRASALMALGEPRWNSFCALGKLVGMLALIPLGFAQFGFVGAVAGYALAEVPRYAVSVLGCHRHGLGHYGQDAEFAAWFAAVALGVAWLDAQLRDLAPAWLRCLGVFVAVSACWAPFGLRYLRRQAR